VAGRALLVVAVVLVAAVAGSAAAPTRGTIAFVRFTAKSGHPRIYTVPAAGGVARQVRLPVAAAQAPALSPNGRLLVFVGGTNRPGERSISEDDELYVATTAGKGMRRLTRSPDHEGSASWSPDGKRIVFVRSSPRGTHSTIWTVNSDGRGLRRVTRGPIDVEPSWSRQGWIAFLRIDPATFQSGIWLVRPDGTRLHRILGGLRSASNPVWSPDGRRLLVQVLRDMYTVRPDGRARRRVATLATDRLGTLEDPQPSWSPDGRWIVFSQLRPGSLGRSDVWIVGSDGADLRRLTRSPEIDTDPSWGGLTPGG
jgi:TolB protein